MKVGEVIVSTLNGLLQSFIGHFFLHQAPMTDMKIAFNFYTSENKKLSILSIIDICQMQTYTTKYMHFIYDHFSFREGSTHLNCKSCNLLNNVGIPECKPLYNYLPEQKYSFFWNYKTINMLPGDKQALKKISVSRAAWSFNRKSWKNGDSQKNPNHITPRLSSAFLFQNTHGIFKEIHRLSKRFRVFTLKNEIQQLLALLLPWLNVVWLSSIT